MDALVFALLEMGTKMIQDIFPKIYHNDYHEKTPGAEDFILAFHDNCVLIRYEENRIRYPRQKELGEAVGSYVYLFSIDTADYYLIFPEEKLMMEGYSYEKTSSFRTTISKHTAFAGITAYHLYCWYRDNQFCGRCGKRTMPDHRERMLSCPHCGNMIYPKISPAVIVAIVNGDKILLSKYAGRDYTNYALIAGFAEIGEAIEDTVRREVMEEVGLKIKNIRYYKSQPWAFSSSLLLGFFAELKGSDEITLEEEELAEAGWYSRGEITLQDDGISLTREMITCFMRNEDKI